MRLRSYALEREVERLLTEGRPELAVLVAQTLLELRVEAELVEFFDMIHQQTLGDATLDLLPSYNIGNTRVQAFFERLVGVRMSDENAKVMAELRAHVKRRNLIAHAGEQVSREDSEASFAAVLAVCELVHELSYRALGLEDELEEERHQGCEGEEDEWR